MKFYRCRQDRPSPLQVFNRSGQDDLSRGDLLQDGRGGPRGFGRKRRERYRLPLSLPRKRPARTGRKPRKRAKALDSRSQEEGESLRTPISNTEGVEAKVCALEGKKSQKAREATQAALTLEGAARAGEGNRFELERRAGRTRKWPLGAALRRVGREAPRAGQ